jgi:hypothetical protein
MIMIKKKIRKLNETYKTSNIPLKGQTYESWSQQKEKRSKLNREDQNRTSPYHIIVKTLSTPNKEIILKVARELH